MNLNGIIYSSIVVPANKSPDGETPERVVATKEVNGYAVWREGCDGQKLLTFTSTYERAEAIEFAVDAARRLRGGSAGAREMREALEQIERLAREADSSLVDVGAMLGDIARAALAKAAA